MEIAGYFASVLIGISLGLIGGGGSILTLPVLVYLFGVNEVLAIAYSLFIVGTTSFAGSITYIRRGWVDVKTAVVFGIPSVIAVFLARTFLLPAIPLELFRLGDFTMTKPVLLMLIFALLMIAASYSMIRKENTSKKNPPVKKKYHLLILSEGFFTGTLTGLIGAGGGFLIIPVLVNLLKMPVKTAIGTSLVIISLSSLVGFLFSLSHHSIHWPFLLSISFMALIGILIGNYLAAKIDSKRLKPAFGWFVLVMGIYIVIKETVFK